MRNFPNLIILASFFALCLIVSTQAESSNNSKKSESASVEPESESGTPISVNKPKTVNPIQAKPHRPTPFQTNCKTDDIQSMLDSILATGKVFVPAQNSLDQQSKNILDTEKESQKKSTVNRDSSNEKKPQVRKIETFESQKDSFMIFLNKLQRVLSFSTGIG